MRNFRFLSTDVFTIFQRGVVFRGLVEVGSVSTGDRISLATRSGHLTASVAAIELDRKLIATSVNGVELGLLLTDFDRESVGSLVRIVVDDSNASGIPSIQTVLDVEMPVILEAPAE